MPYAICWTDTSKGFKENEQRECHRFDIFHYSDNFTNVSMHFNENGHTPNDFSFAPIDMAKIIKGNLLDASPKYTSSKWYEF